MLGLSVGKTFGYLIEMILGVNGGSVEGRIFGSTLGDAYGAPMGTSVG